MEVPLSLFTSCTTKTTYLKQLAKDMQKCPKHFNTLAYSYFLHAADYIRMSDRFCCKLHYNLTIIWYSLNATDCTCQSQILRLLRGDTYKRSKISRERLHEYEFFEYIKSLTLGDKRQDEYEFLSITVHLRSAIKGRMNMNC
jgi:hypothetical protein